jgi:hypothetical protein
MPTQARDLATIRTVVSSVGKPVNVIMTHGDRG